MPAHEQSLDRFPVFTGTQFGIPQAMFHIRGCVYISMRLEVTHLTAKRLLVGAIGFIDGVTHAAFLRRIRALHFGRLYPALGTIPLNLLRDVRQVGCPHVGVHSPCLVLHGSHRKLLVGKLDIRVLGKALVDRPVDLLTDMPD